MVWGPNARPERAPQFTPEFGNLHRTGQLADNAPEVPLHQSQRDPAAFEAQQIAFPVPGQQVHQRARQPELEIRPQGELLPGCRPRRIRGLETDNGADVGSPPRAWGRRDAQAWLGDEPRFTPTGVGTAHFDYCNVPHETGSPPRAWGRPRGTSIRGGASRFTPTGVGTAPWVAFQFVIPSVHPHGRGDGHIEYQALRGHVGSPPRAWGRPCY